MIRTTSRPARKRITFVLLALAGTSLLTAGGIAGASIAARTATAGPERVVEIPTAAEPVSAEELWEASVAAVECFESNDVGTVGPYPSADGASVQFSFRAVPDALEVEERCIADLNPLARRFALDASEVEADRLIAIRASIESCVTDLGNLRVPEAPDSADALELSAHAEPDDFKACALSAR